MNEERRRTALELKHQQNVARAEGYRNIKKEKANEEERERINLLIEKEQGLIKAIVSVPHLE
jgi:hypothetical protein